MAQIHTNHQGHIAIELRRTGRSLKTVVAILGHDGKLRRVRKFTAGAFDKDYHPLPTTIDHVAFRWLESHNNNQRLLSEGALKEIIMLLIIKDNKVVAKFADNQTTQCQAAIDAVDGVCERIASVADLCEYSGKDLAELYNSLIPISVPKVRLPLKESKEKLAQKVWERYKGIAAEKPVAKSVGAAVKNNTASAGKEVKKMGYKGHQPESMKGRCHEIFDKLKAEGKERKDIIAAIVAEGAAPATAGSWYGYFSKPTAEVTTSTEVTI